MIYFIESQSVTPEPLIKIGFTDREPKVRIRENQRNNPSLIKTLAICEGDKDLDQYLKNRFRHLMFLPSPQLNSSEWYHPSEELRRLIDEIRKS